MHLSLSNQNCYFFKRSLLTYSIFIYWYCLHIFFFETNTFIFWIKKM